MGSIKEALERVNKAIEKAQKNQKNNKTFCGPNQTFPSTTCEQAEASMKKVFKAKLDGNQKSKIMKCLNGRLKSMKCRG